MSHFVRLRSLAGVLAAAAAMSLPGCYAETALAARPTYVQASAAPTDLAVCQHSFYEGRAVYYSGDRWYAHDRGQWVYYRDEPVTLHQERMNQQRLLLQPARVRDRALVEVSRQEPSAQLQ